MFEGRLRIEGASSDCDCDNGRRSHEAMGEVIHGNANVIFLSASTVKYSLPFAKARWCGRDSGLHRAHYG